MTVEYFCDGIKFNEIIYEKNDKFIKIKYKNNLLNIETPILKIPFGIKEFDGNNGRKLYLQLSIDKEIEINNDFLIFIEMLESHAKENVNHICKEKKFMSKIYKNEKYTPFINIDLKESTIIYNEKNNILEINDYINRNFTGIIDFSYTGIWYNDDKYGLSMKINTIFIKETDIKIVFRPNPQTIK
jgi:hypothetical protein